MSKESVINLDPWNNNNHLLTEDHVYHIFEKLIASSSHLNRHTFPSKLFDLYTYSIENKEVRE